MKPVIAVLGEGAWGSAIAQVAALNGCTVYLWCHHAEIAQEIREQRTNKRYIPYLTYSELIIPTTDISEALQKSTLIFEAIPVAYLRSVLQQAHAYVTAAHRWIVLSKGIEYSTGLLPSEIIKEIVGAPTPLAVLVGPSFAKNLLEKDFTSVMVATDSDLLFTAVCSALSADYFTLQRTNDLIGVQICSALKNVFALGVGILQGAGFSDNTRAAFLTAGLNEMQECVRSYGGDPSTVYGLAGVGDLLLTALGSSSRNLTVGQRLGNGETLGAILEQTGYTPEAINTLQAFSSFLKRQPVASSLPLLNALEGIMQGRPVSSLIKLLSQ